MLKRIISFFTILLSPCLSYYYVRYNSMIYNLNIEPNVISTDFVSLFPYDFSLFDSISPNYYIIGRARKKYEESLFNSRFTFLKGDIALLDDYTYVIFKEPTLYKNKSGYIGNINNFNEIIKNVTIYNFTTDHQLFFENEDICSPFLLSINAEGQHIVHLNKEGPAKGSGCYSLGEDGCDVYMTDYYYYGIINFSTRKTKKLTKVPPIYLNNSYLGDDCQIENDSYSIRCIIREEKWDSNVTYKVNELYEGCYGPIFTSISLYIPYVEHPALIAYSYSEKINVNLFLILLFHILLF